MVKVHIIESESGFGQKIDETKEFPDEEILWEHSPEWLGRQRFDISIPKYNIAIEYNGRQHYTPVKRFGGKLGYELTIERDTVKRNKCKLNEWTIFDLKYNYTESDYQNLLNSIRSKI